MTKRFYHIVLISPSLSRRFFDHGLHGLLRWSRIKGKHLQIPSYPCDPCHPWFTSVPAGPSWLRYETQWRRSCLLLRKCAAANVKRRILERNRPQNVRFLTSAATLFKRVLRPPPDSFTCLEPHVPKADTHSLSLRATYSLSMPPFGPFSGMPVANATHGDMARQTNNVIQSLTQLATQNPGLRRRCTGLQRGSK